MTSLTKFRRSVYQAIDERIPSLRISGSARLAQTAIIEYMVGSLASGESLSIEGLGTVFLVLGDEGFEVRFLLGPTDEQIAEKERKKEAFPELMRRKRFDAAVLDARKRMRTPKARIRRHYIDARKSTDIGRQERAKRVLKRFKGDRL